MYLESLLHCLSKDDRYEVKWCQMVTKHIALPLSLILSAENPSMCKIPEDSQKDGESKGRKWKVPFLEQLGIILKENDKTKH